MVGGWYKSWTFEKTQNKFFLNLLLHAPVIKTGQDIGCTHVNIVNTLSETYIKLIGLGKMKVWRFDDPLVYNIILIFFFHFLPVTFSFDFQIGEEVDCEQSLFLFRNTTACAKNQGDLGRKEWGCKQINFFFLKFAPLFFAASGIPNYLHIL